MQFYVEYDVASLIISLAVFFSFFRKKIINTKLTDLFMVLVLMILNSSILDIITVYTIRDSQKIPLWVNYILNCLYYISIISLSPMFYNCLRYAPSGKENLTRKEKYILMLPYIFGVILIIINPFTKMIFYFDENRLYHHNWGLFVEQGISFVYIIYAIIKTIRNKEIKSVSQKIVIYIYIFGNILAVLIQTINPKLLITTFVASITAMITFLTIVTPGNYIDKEMDVLNFDAFNDVADQYINREKPFRVLGIQIIGIKYLNETIGYENKAKLLKHISDLLKSVCGKYQLYRMSATRLLTIIPDDEAIQNKIIEELHVVFSESVIMGEFKISLSERIAYLRFPDDAITVLDMLELIRTSLHGIMESEPGTVVRVEKSNLEKKHRELLILQVMKNAVRRGNFYVVYQPIYSFEKKRFTTAEALVRLDSDILGDVSPEEFIPIAEQNGMILQIGEYVFETVCRFILNQRIWEKGIEYIHVNLSVIQCMQEKLAEQLFNIMDLYNLDYRYINLEVTETAAVASSEILMNNMKKLIARNMNFSLDDFGTGFSNMASLIKYPFHTIKLDKGMVWDAMHNKKAETVLKNTIEMVKKLDMEIVAEGAETTEQVEKLYNMGCDFVQGFYYSKPMSRNDFIELLKNNATNVIEGV